MQNSERALWTLNILVMKLATKPSHPHHFFQINPILWSIAKLSNTIRVLLDQIDLGKVLPVQKYWLTIIDNLHQTVEKASVCGSSRQCTTQSLLVSLSDYNLLFGLPSDTICQTQKTWKSCVQLFLVNSCWMFNK